jgi:arabinogalactan oligomer/maltooligosaccharide transport system permease protein
MTTHSTSHKPGWMLSHVIMGGTQIQNGHVVKGLAYMAIQIAVVLHLGEIFASLQGLATLGTVVQQIKGFRVIAGDNSVTLLVWGMSTVLLLLTLAALYWSNVRDARTAEPTQKTVGQQLQGIYEGNFALIMLTPAGLIALGMIILPILITFAVSFTDYSAPNHIPPRNLINWVGLDSYTSLLRLDIWSGTFVSVATWTVIWAVAATLLTFGFGFLLALALSRRNIRGKKIWRVIFILPHAIPVFVSLLAFRVLLGGVGPVNTALSDIGFGAVPFLTDPLLAKITCIVLAVWVGAPYFMLMIEGAMTNIPGDIYEASEVDGAGKLRQFSEITLPMVMSQLAPSLVMTFAYNFNNFGSVYLLTEGGPVNPDYRFAGHTDLLITWIYKLTLDFQQYNVAAVVSVVIFLFLSTMAIWQFRRMQSFKDEVGV